MKLKRNLGLTTAVLVVVASMIGSGILGSTGLAQENVGNAAGVMLLWVFCGLVALAGALCYAELAVAMPHAGGEYIYLKNIFGALPSFLSGWVSFIVGFSAPVAAACLLSGDYALKILPPDGALSAWLADHIVLFSFDAPAPYTALTLSHKKVYACGLVLLFSAIHILGSRSGGIFQSILTSIKLALIFTFTGAGLYVGLSGGGIPLSETFQDVSLDFSGLGVGFMFVFFAFCGFNGATYLAEEIKDPDRNLPRALLYGTVLVTCLYILINIVYYMAIPVDQLAGETAVASVAAGNLFGPWVKTFYNYVFAFMLFSSISAMTMIGPRVYFAMARDNLFFKMAARISPTFQTPMMAILLQAVLAMLYILTGTYESISFFMQYALSIFPVLTVLGLFLLRKNNPELKSKYRTPFFPALPLFFAFFSVAMMFLAYREWTETSQIAIGAVLLGVPIYFVWVWIQRGSKGISQGPPPINTGIILDRIPIETEVVEEEPPRPAALAGMSAGDRD